MSVILSMLLACFDGGAAYTGVAPISVSGPEISCTPASNVVGGCLTTGSQYIGGAKHFTSAPDFPSAYVSELLPLLDGVGIEIQGRRHAGDTGSTADVVLRSLNTRADVAQVVGVYNSGTEVCAINGTGTVVAGLANNNPVAFQDGNGTSGHITLSSFNGSTFGGYGVLQEHVAKNRQYGYDAGLLVEYPYGGEHGGWELVSATPDGGPREAGWVLFLANGRGRFDYNGAYQQVGMNLADFGQHPRVGISVIGGGTNYLGQSESALMYALDKHRWYFADGTQWVGLATKTEIDLINARLADAGIP